MNFDLRTLFIQTTITYAFLSFAMLFYARNHKTYPGFTLWMAGMFLATLGYLAVVIRGSIPDWLSILGNNTLFVTAAVLRFDGTVQFMRDSKANKLFYTLPVVMLLIASYYYFVDDQIATRALALSIIVGGVCLAIAYELLRHRPKGRALIYSACASLFILFAISMIVRGIAWFINPTQEIFQATPVQTGYAMGLAIMELGWVVSFLMLNSQRLESELKKSEAHLLDSVNSLKQALSEIKTLAGLLPICSSCKKIRDDRGYWNTLEKYIMMHSEAQFTHGICPDCAREHYPDHFVDTDDSPKDNPA